MHERDKRLIVGLALALGLMVIVPFGALTFTGLVTAPAGAQQTSYATPILLLMAVASAGILYYVFKRRI